MPWVVFGAVGLAVAGFALSRIGAPGTEPALPSAAPAASSAPPPEESAAPVLPETAPPVTEVRRAFVGRKRCGECHKEQHKGWEHDFHARALSPATGKNVAGDFKNAHFKGTSSEAWMSEDKGRPRMRTAGQDGSPATFPVDWVIGAKRMQDTVTISPDGRWQVLPVYFHITGKGEWVDYTEKQQGALGPDHPFFWANFRRTANRECLDCHVTGMDVRYQRDTHQWTTQMVDAGVSCESCHGPGGRHAETQAPEDIVHPGKAKKEIGFALCAQCHGPRNPLFPLLDAAHHFIPGQRYEDFFQPQGLWNGGQRSGDFFADGRPKTSSFEVQALIQSRCYLKGQATCLTCHGSPHGKHDPNEMRPPTAEALAAVQSGSGVTRVDVSACQGCHAAVFAEGRAHSHHKADAAQSCIACHMPKVVTGVLDAFVDHAIDIPAPENTARHSIPNACSLCHAKDTPAALSKAIASWFPDASTKVARRLRLADAFDDATADESRVALLAVLADAEEAPFLRATAAGLFAQRFPTEAAGPILALLASPDALLRAKAAEALGAAKAKTTAERLGALRSDPSLAVREAGAIALAELDDRRAEAALRALTLGRQSAALPRPHALLGFLLSRRGEAREAITEIERAVDLQPYYVDALMMLGELYAKDQKLDRARARLEEALTFDPQNAAAKRRLAALGGGR